MDKNLEKSMEHYRDSLKPQTIMQATGAAILLVFNVLSISGIISPSPAANTWNAVWTGFISGASAAALLFLLVGMIMNIQAMKNEEKLKKMFIKANDERTMEICYRSAHTSYWPDVIGLLLGAVISGYFNPVISVTCIGCLMYICIVRVILKLSYSRKL